jgi:four helix bundle protein
MSSERQNPKSKNSDSAKGKVAYKLDEREEIGDVKQWTVNEEGVPYDLRERLFRFAVKVVKLVRTFPRTVEGIEVGRQLLKAGTSAGANYEEADGAQSRADFVAKASISRKETKEARFWLRLVRACEIGDQKLAAELHGESKELVRILSSIIQRASHNV